jgi:DNA-binding protein HU-beta
MNKNELVSAIAGKSGLTKAQAGDALEATIAAITGALVSGDDVRILGFGNFEVAHRKATTARNPRTGETVNVPASRAPKFKAGKALKDAVAG